MNDKVDNNITDYPNRIDTRVALLEASISHINDTLNRLDKRFDKIDKQFDDVKNEIKDIRKEMKYDFRFLIGAICVLGGIMAHGFHWF